jgi:hypothetical protein
MFTYSEIQLHMLRHKDLFPESEECRILDLLEQQSCVQTGLYAQEVAKAVFGEGAETFLTEMEKDPLHQFFVKQQQESEQRIEMETHSMPVFSAQELGTTGGGHYRDPFRFPR